MTTRRPGHKPVGGLIAPDLKSTSAPGRRLTFIAGFVPRVAGLTVLLAPRVGLVHAGSAWWAGDRTDDRCGGW